MTLLVTAQHNTAVAAIARCVLPSNALFIAKQHIAFLHIMYCFVRNNTAFGPKDQGLVDVRPRSCACKTKVLSM